MSEHAAALHREAIVWDTHGGFSPFADLDLSFLERWLAAGATYLSVNVGYDHVITWQDTIRAIAHFRRWIMLHPLKFMLAETPADIARAKHDGKLAIAFDLEGTDALDGNIEMIAFYYRLGVRQMLFAYNRTNRFAGGCHDDDIGLTSLGREALAEMNRIGMVVDCSHTSHRSTMEMMERSTAPVVFSHSNPRSLCDHGRNIRDDQIRACAGTGGVIGINGVGAFLGEHGALPRR
jgi:membrane dipeptidase